MLRILTDAVKINTAGVGGRGWGGPAVVMCMQPHPISGGGSPVFMYVSGLEGGAM